MTAPDENAPQVIVGDDGWLFLKEGANQSYSYLTGKSPVDMRVELHWRQTIRRRQTLFPGCLHLICPEKLAVFPEKLPGFHLDETRLGRRLANIDDVLYPIETLRHDNIDGVHSYSKTDTHFSDLGALIVARDVAQRFGVVEDISVNWSTRQIIGDLGIKLNPTQPSVSLSLTSDREIAVQDNGLNNRGRMTYFENKRASGGRLLVFGDSFTGINLGRTLALFFREVLFIHSLAADYRVVASFTPDHILFEFSERFLRDTTADGLSIESLIVQKFLDGQRDAVLRWQEDTNNITQHLLDWTLVDFYRTLVAKACEDQKGRLMQ
jgi:hypothetical protein